MSEPMIKQGEWKARVTAGVAGAIALPSCVAVMWLLLDSTARVLTGLAGLGAIFIWPPMVAAGVAYLIAIAKAGRAAWATAGMPPRQRMYVGGTGAQVALILLVLIALGALTPGNKSRMLSEDYSRVPAQVLLAVSVIGLPYAPVLGRMCAGSYRSESSTPRPGVGMASVCALLLLPAMLFWMTPSVPEVFPPAFLLVSLLALVSIGLGVASLARGPGARGLRRLALWAPIVLYVVIWLLSNASLVHWLRYSLRSRRLIEGSGSAVSAETQDLWLINLLWVMLLLPLCLRVVGRAHSPGRSAEPAEQTQT